MMVSKNEYGDFWLRATTGIGVSFDAYKYDSKCHFITLYKDGRSTAVIDARDSKFSQLADELRKIRVPSPFRANLIKHNKARQAAAI